MLFESLIIYPYFSSNNWSNWVSEKFTINSIPSAGFSTHSIIFLSLLNERFTPIVSVRAAGYVNNPLFDAAQITNVDFKFSRITCISLAPLIPNTPILSDTNSKSWLTQYWSAFNKLA